MAIKDTQEGKEKGILLYRHILDVKEYRALAAVSDFTGQTLNCLKEQLAEPSGPGKDFWWSPVTDLELLKVKALGKSIKVAIVTDGKFAIICELPNSVHKNMFVKVD